MYKRKLMRVFRVFQHVAVDHEMAEPLTPSPSFVRTTRRPLCLKTAQGKHSSRATGDPYQCFRGRAGKARIIQDGMAQSRAEHRLPCPQLIKRSQRKRAAGIGKEN